MFSTDCSVKAVQPSHVLRKQLVEILAGFQSSKTPAGNVVRDAQFNHDELNVVPLETSIPEGKEISPEQLNHALAKFVPLDRSRAGKEIKA